MSAAGDDPTDTGVNPPHVGGPPPAMSKGELYEYHKNNDTLEKYYMLYPLERPGGRER